MITTGARLSSQVCDTEVIVVKAGQSLTDLRAGGAPMVPIGTPKDPAVAIDPAFAQPTLMGKRYVDGTGAEVLVTKAGLGALSIGTQPLALKQAKPLPASD